MDIFIRRVRNFRSLDIEPFEMVGVGFKVFYFAIDKSRGLRVKGGRLNLEDNFFDFVSRIQGDALKGYFGVIRGVIFGLDVF